MSNTFFLETRKKGCLDVFKKTVFLIILIAMILSPSAVFSADVPDAFFVTADNVDPLYATPVIDREVLMGTHLNAVEYSQQSIS